MYRIAVLGGSRRDSAESQTRFIGKEPSPHAVQHCAAQKQPEIGSTI